MRQIQNSCPRNVQRLQANEIQINRIGITRFRVLSAQMLLSVRPTDRPTHANKRETA